MVPSSINYSCNGLNNRLTNKDGTGTTHSISVRFRSFFPYRCEREKFQSAVPVGEPEKPGSDVLCGLTIIAFYKAVRDTHIEILVGLGSSLCLEQVRLYCSVAEKKIETEPKGHPIWASACQITQEKPSGPQFGFT